MLNYQDLCDRCTGMDRESNVAYLCVNCGHEHPVPVLKCVQCAHAVDSFYDLGRVRIGEEIDPLQRYFDLLPVKQRRYLAWTGEGNTPLLEPPVLRKRLGLPNLFLKDETRNPTASTKDRMAAVVVALLRENGVKSFALSSTGNSSTAIARVVQMVKDIEVHVFVGSDWLTRLNYPDSANVFTYSLDTTFVGASDASKLFSNAHGLHAEGGFFNLGRREGLKLAYLEAFDQMTQGPEVVVQAISSGMGLLGGYKGAIEYHKLGRLTRVPRFYGVQQESCAPIANAYKDGCKAMLPKYIVSEPNGIAKAILRGNATEAYPYIRELCDQSGGGMESVSEEEILTARGLLREMDGIEACNASATCFAGLLKMVKNGQVAKDARILAILTGNDRASVPCPTQVTHYSREQVSSSAYLSSYEPSKAPA